MPLAEDDLQARALRILGYDGVPRMPPLVFVEVNNPLRMSPEEIADDTAHAGIDPYRRYRHWLRSGLRPLDLAYVQPPLRLGESPVRYLDLFCNSNLPSVPSAVVLHHLRAFISISVLKGKSADGDPDFAAMRDQLAARDIVAFIPDDYAELQAICDRAAELSITFATHLPRRYSRRERLRRAANSIDWTIRRAPSRRRIEDTRERAPSRSPTRDRTAGLEVAPTRSGAAWPDLQRSV